MNDENLTWLLKCYHNHYNDYRGHDNWIKISTLDNPGWRFKVCLDKTELQNKKFEEISIDRSEEDWIRCSINNMIFEGYGGLFNLPEILNVFRKWAEVDCQNCLEKVTTNDENLIWLIKWYHSYCNGDWEHCNGIWIGSISKPGPGCFLKIFLEETDLENKQFKKTNIVRSKEDWVYCYIEHEMFEGYGGPFNLSEMLNIFRKWVESCS